MSEELEFDVLVSNVMDYVVGHLSTSLTNSIYKDPGFRQAIEEYLTDAMHLVKPALMLPPRQAKPPMAIAEEDET